MSTGIMNSLSQKERIAQAALKIFSDKGYAGTTITEIADRAGVNPATIYRFFTGKKALFQSLNRPDLDFPDRQEQVRREEILGVALQVFSRKGYAAATMDDIAAAAGLSKAGIYFYYPSKEALFSAVMENPAAFTAVEACFNKFHIEGVHGLEESLVELARTYLTFFENEAFTARLKIILSEGTQDPLIGSLFKEKIAKHGSEIVASRLSDYCRLSPGDLQSRVRMLFGMLFSWGLLNILLPGNTETQYDPERSAREHVHQFIYGIEADLIRDDY